KDPALLLANCLSVFRASTGSLALLRSINFFRRIRAFRNDPHISAGFDGTKEAASIAFVTDAWPDSFDAHQQSVRVAIHANFAVQKQKTRQAWSCRRAEECFV